MSKRSKKNYYDNISDRIVKIIPLGGLEQIGMNMTVLEYGESIVVVDAGLAFPTDEMPGIDLVVPDITYLKEHQEKVRGFFITHGHEDHIGALPYVLKEINVPVYATKLTMAVIETKLAEHDLLGTVERHVAEAGETVSAGDFKVEFIHVNHSITDAVAFAITSPAGTVIMTGDFKIDYTPVKGEPADLQRFGELGRQGVLVLLSDSTNAQRPGFTPSEQNVSEFFDDAFREYKDHRILIATFASNLDRVQQIIRNAAESGRKVAVEGRSMVNIIEIAKNLGYLSVPDGVLVEMDELASYPIAKTCILMTGSQGEAMAALTRVASGQHRTISITPGDVVVFSSTPIPGNEKSVYKVINDLSRRGATIVNRATHVSGHACEEELKLIYALTEPQYAVPVHGEFRHRQANAEIAVSMRVEKENVFLLDSGDVLELSKTKAEVTGRVPQGMVLVDGLGVGDVGSVVLRDRQNLSQDGIIIVAVGLSKDMRCITSGPEVISRGFVYMRDAGNVMEELRQTAETAVRTVMETKYPDRGRMKNEIREAIGAYVWKTVKRSPVIVPVILETE